MDRYINRRKIGNDLMYTTSPLLEVPSTLLQYTKASLQVRTTTFVGRSKDT